ncbi:MAG: hypothetical protein PHV32_04325 [Eubacteriales bacterium]|nr:hypothetical protein [Eubacteriales bacterium]
MSEKTFTGLYTETDTLEKINQSLEKANCRTRNEFINKAIDFYLTYLNGKDYTDILTPAFESVIGAKIQDTENRLARVLFKQGVELAMLMNVIAGTNEIDEHTLAELRKHCVNEVSRLSGRYSFDDAVKLQKS